MEETQQIEMNSKDAEERAWDELLQKRGELTLARNEYRAKRVTDHLETLEKVMRASDALIKVNAKWEAAAKAKQRSKCACRPAIE